MFCTWPDLLLFIIVSAPAGDRRRYECFIRDLMVRKRRESAARGGGIVASGGEVGAVSGPTVAVYIMYM